MTDVATRDDVARVSALFTRGAMDAPDLRGDSMVTKHLEKLQQEKEKQGFAKMQALHPSIGPTVCAIALEETDWEVEAAHELLSRFEDENKERIALLLLVSEIPAAFRRVICSYAHTQLAFPAASTSLLSLHIKDASDILHTGALVKSKLRLPDRLSNTACTSFLRTTVREIGVSTYISSSTEKRWSFEGCLSSPS